MTTELDKTNHNGSSGATRSRGRAVGDTNRYSKDSVRRLAVLGYDPMEEMVNLAWELKQEAQEIKYHPDGSKKERYSQMALAANYATQQKLINDLMRYGYARVPESLNLEPKDLPAININLTTPETFKQLAVMDAEGVDVDLLNESVLNHE